MPRGEVGRRPGARDGGPGRRTPHQPQRQRHHRRLAGADRATDRRCHRGPRRRRRDHRAQRARSPRLPGARRADPRAQGDHGRPAGGAGPGDVHGLRPAPPRRRGPHRQTAHGAPRPARGPRPGQLRLAGARHVRRRRDALRRHQVPGSRGHRQQAAGLALPTGGADAPAGSSSRIATGRRTSSVAGDRRPAAPTLPRCSSASRRPPACSTAAGSGAASGRSSRGCWPSWWRR